MVTARRSGIGTAVAAVVVIVIVVVAFGVSFALSSKGGSQTTTSSTSTTSSIVVTTSSTESSSAVQTSNSSTTVSSTSTTTGCTFTNPAPLLVANTTVPPIFTGCLTAGASGNYTLAVTDPNGVIVQGVIRTQYAALIEVVGAPVLNQTAAGHGAVAEMANDSTVLPMPDLSLFAHSGYAVVIVNQSGQNNTVTVNLLLTDTISYEGG